MSRELWGITPYFNPEQYKSKYKNYRAFRTSTQKQGLPLIAVECAFGDIPFELSQDDADILVQVRCNSVLWQKERLLNIALEHLPKDCTKVAWLDADILFLNNNWISETTSLLDTYNVVQLFDTAVRLKKNQKFTKIGNFKEGCANGKRRNGYVYQKIRDPNNKYYPVTGFGWAIRRGIIEKFGFYDKMILGGGDSVMLRAMYDKDFNYEIVHNRSLDKDISVWVQRISDLCQYNTYYVTGIALHLYHGEQQNRRYGNRYTLMSNIVFDPDTDIVLNEDGCWEFKDENTELQRIIKEYFSGRDEDSKEIGDYPKSIKYKLVLLKQAYRLFINKTKTYIKKNPSLYEVCIFILRVTYKVFNLIRMRAKRWSKNLSMYFVKSYYHFYYSRVLAEIIKKDFSKRDDITIVIGIKNKQKYYLKNAVRSIRNQDYNQSLIEIILVDYDSLCSFSQEYKEICTEFNAQYIEIENAQVWNRSHCLNIGIKQANTKFVLTSDVDIFFETNYITEAIKALQKNPYQVVVSKMLDSPEGLIGDNTDILADYQFLKSQSVYRGVIQNPAKSTYFFGKSINCAYTAYYKYVHGYDENYIIWGCEDDDIIKRFNLFGLTLKDISDTTCHIHQWHPIIHSTHSHSPAHKEFLANKQYFKNHHTVVRNKKGWGQPEKTSTNFPYNLRLKETLLTLLDSIGIK